MKATIYDYIVKDLAGNDVYLKDYKGKVILIVNTASECHFTPQYGELEELYQTYQDRGFMVLAFPSNDFGEQEPLEGEEIQLLCDSEYHNTFPILDKIKVKGSNADPLYHFLSTKALNGKVNVPPVWNFHKYLVDRNGFVVDYFLTITNPMNSRIRKKIEELLNQ